MKSSNQPIYLEVYYDLLNKISDGHYSERNPLPSERRLCSIYNVSRSTIRRTMEALRKDKYIKTIHGSGNYVEPKVYYQPLTKFHSFANNFKANGLVFTTEILDYELIDYDNFLRKIIPECTYTKWHKLTRLRKDNSSELMVEVSYLPQNRFYNVDVEYLKTHSLYKYLVSFYNMNINRAVEFLSPTLPTSKEADLLHIPTKSPCMIMERICYEKDDIIIIHKNIVRGDKYKFKTEYSAIDSINSLNKDN